MMSHDLAKLLLDLPNHQVIEQSEGITDFEPGIGQEVDTNHPDFESYDPDNEENYNTWRERQPKKAVIFI